MDGLMHGWPNAWMEAWAKIYRSSDEDMAMSPLSNPVVRHGAV